MNQEAALTLSDNPGEDGIRCQLIDSELTERRNTLVESARQYVIGWNELDNGFAFRFPGGDDVLDNLIDFVKAERKCCPFFTFNLTVSNAEHEIRLDLTGANGVKEFIRGELLQ